MFIASHIMIHEDAPGLGQTWSDPIPHKLQQMQFDTMDVLYISPFVVRDDGTFGTQKMPETPKQPAGNLDGRLEWVIRKARGRNPRIKIIAMQMNQTGHDFGRLTGDAVAQGKYARSVKYFLEDWNDENRKPGLRIDGYDVDYEWNDREKNDWGNMQPDSAKILKQIRSEIDLTIRGPRYQLSISPADTKHLTKQDELANILDYINMQRYDGGSDTKAQTWIEDIGIPPSKLLWGISLEQPWKCDEVDSINDIVSKCKQTWGDGSNAAPLAGIMIWRMNSDNWVFEDMASQVVRAKIGRRVNRPILEERVNEGWKNGGRIGQTEEDIGWFTPWFREENWIAASKYRNTEDQD